MISKKAEKVRTEWQTVTLKDMEYSLNNFGKYAMIRPTGFGKTYLSAQATNLKGIRDKKVVFVYVSEILKRTFEEYCKPIISKDKVIEPIVRDAESRLKFETYTSVTYKWSDKEYLNELLDGVGLVIFDEMQRMGASGAVKNITKAIKEFKKRGIKYIGASATPERNYGVDVCSKFFTHKYNDGSRTYCWGEHIYTLSNAFEYGLLQTPLYKYINEDKDKIKKVRHTRESMIQELKAEAVGKKNKSEKVLDDIKDLERAVIKNSDKALFDGIYELNNVENPYRNRETLRGVSKNIEKPKEFDSYMRFLVFAPNRASLSDSRVVYTDKDSKEFGGIVKETLKDFKNAFERFGYKVRYLVISSTSTEETKNVELIDPDFSKLTDEQAKRAIYKEDMTIDLIFSINMLNVGYHVNDITGLILKRWTGSNQIYYQQLGRCLSADNKKKAIIFDFVKSIDSRGISAPMFNKSEDTKEKTKNADGTTLVTYKDKKRERKKNTKSNKYVMDADGNLIDPNECNVIDSKYIKCELVNADLELIESRLRVYELRKYSSELFEKAYRLYADTYVVDDNKLVSNIHKGMAFSDSLRLAVQEENKGYNFKEITLNFIDYLLYCKNKAKNIYLPSIVLDRYIESNLPESYTSEVNSILSMCEGGGIKLNILSDTDVLSRQIIDKTKEMNVNVVRY